MIEARQLCVLFLGVAAMHGVNAKIVAVEVLRQHFAELHIVVDQQNVFHRNGHNQRKPCARLCL